LPYHPSAVSVVEPVMVTSFVELPNMLRSRPWSATCVSHTFLVPALSDTALPLFDDAMMWSRLNVVVVASVPSPTSHSFADSCSMT